MISQLSINNFGLIDNITIEFCKALNTFTGETGAGKTILIDALRFALGERLNTRQVRDNNKPCTVEVVFELTDTQLAESDIFSEFISDDDPIIIIRRTYSPDGRTKNKINGITVTAVQLKELGNHLVDLHGPHDHQMLLCESSHIGILDRLIDLTEELNSYLKEYDVLVTLKKKLKDLETLSETKERELDLVSHQIKELEQVPLNQSEYESVLSESAKLNNAEKLYECVRQLVDILENDQSGISTVTSQAFSHMKTLTATDESAEHFAELLSRIQDDSAELLTGLNNYLESLSFEPGRSEEINRKYDAYYEILRKYGPSLEDANIFYTKIKEKHSLLIDFEHNSSELTGKIKLQEDLLGKLAKKISDKRKKAAKSLEKTIENELKELGIKHVNFECRIEKTDLSKTGWDNVSFYISPNAGEDLKPLSEIISSGEAARMMLALKKALTKVDPIPVLVFDEIDAQIGGRLGTITGQKLKQLAKDRQVILITHLPQIASFGNSHFKVTKKVANNRTSTEVLLLEDDLRIKELAKMMSGEKESEIAITHAKELLAKAI